VVVSLVVEVAVTVTCRLVVVVMVSVGRERHAQALEIWEQSKCSNHGGALPHVGVGGDLEVVICFVVDAFVVVRDDVLRVIDDVLQEVVECGNDFVVAFVVGFVVGFLVVVTFLVVVDDFFAVVFVVLQDFVVVLIFRRSLGKNTVEHAVTVAVLYPGQSSESNSIGLKLNGEGDHELDMGLDNHHCIRCCGYRPANITTYEGSSLNLCCQQGSSSCCRSFEG